jgi:hypothetical protein
MGSPNTRQALKVLVVTTSQQRSISTSRNEHAPENNSASPKRSRRWTETDIRLWTIRDRPQGSTLAKLQRRYRRRFENADTRDAKRAELKDNQELTDTGNLRQISIRAFTACGCVGMMSAFSMGISKTPLSPPGPALSC